MVGTRRRDRVHLASARACGLARVDGGRPLVVAVKQPPAHLVAERQAALAQAQAKRETPLVTNKAKSRKPARKWGEPRPGSQEWKAIHGSKQYVHVRRQRRRAAGGVVHLSKEFYKLSDEEKALISAIQQRGRK